MTDTHLKIALSPDDLLNQKHITPLVQQLRDLVCLPQAHFDLFYLAPIKRFLALTQHCSDAVLVNHFLAVIKALKLRRALILPLDSDAESINKQKDLWTYAIFVGSLMFHSVKLVGQQVVIIDPNGHRKWTPFDPPIPAKYQIQVFEKLQLNDFAANTFLPMIFCAQCLAWLYRDQDVFNAALVLAHSPHRISRIGQLVAKAHNVEIPETQTKAVRYEKKADRNSSTTSPTDAIIPPDDTQPDVTRTNDTVPPFCSWLKAIIENNTYPQFCCETLEGHAICDPLIFEQYCKDTEKDALDIELERTTFFNRGIHKRSPNMKFSGGGIKKAFVIRKLTDLSST